MNILNLEVPLAVPIYMAAIVASRFAFRHRDCLAAAGPAAAPAGRPARGGAWKKSLLCLLPLGVMQIAPCVEYVLRYKQWLRPALPEGAPLPPTMIAGLLVFAAGTLVAAVAARQLAAAWRDDSRGLCTSGLYAVVRHPMYAGYLLQGAGYSLMLGAIWSWALYGLVVPLLFARILVEDREMAGLFPAAFPAYRGRVRRLVPFIF